MQAPVASRRTLSKSDFVSARECAAKLYFREHRSEFPDNRASNPYLGLLANGGFMVEALACAQRPDGILLSYGRNFEDDFRETMKYLERDEVTLFQPTFLYNRRLARVDILEKRGNDIKLLEVKAKSFDSIEHAESLAAGGRGYFRGKRSPFEVKDQWQGKFEDIAFQTVMLRHLLPGMTIRPYLLLVDKTKQALIDDIPTLFQIERDPNDDERILGFQYAGSPDQLAGLDILTEVDMTDEVAILADEVDTDARRFEDLLDAEFAVPLDRGMKCSKCEYRFPDGDTASGFDMCWGDLAKVRPSALELFSLGKIKDTNKQPVIEGLISAGKVSLFDVPVELLRKKDGTVGSQAARQLRQIEHTRANTAWWSDALKGKLESLPFPLHFIDFEGSRIALPYHAKMPPYGQVAFQWSVHTLEAPNAALVHKEWLNVDYVWPNVSFAKSLRDAIGDTGTVLTWSGYEGATLRGIVQEHERFVDRDHELCDWIAEMDERRIFDLLKCANEDYYHPGMRGRTSIKVVIDALWKNDPTLRDQFRQYSGLDAPDTAEDPYKSLPKLVIAGISQDVHEGTGAMRAYEAMMYGAERNDATQRQLWCELLLQYCKLDTLSMVLIYEHWLRCTGLASVPEYSPIMPGARTVH